MVVAVDAKARGDGGWNIFTYGGRNDTGIDAVEYAARAVAKGAGEILLTSMDRDGAKTGYDLPTAAGDHRRGQRPGHRQRRRGQHRPPGRRGEADGGADAVLAASIFHFGEVSIPEAKRAMAAAGIPVRGVPEIAA